MRHVHLGLAVLVGAAVYLAGPGATASGAHQDGCHRWHSCPSDRGTYVCGDLGYTSECGIRYPIDLRVTPGSQLPPVGFTPIATEDKDDGTNTGTWLVLGALILGGLWLMSNNASGSSSEKT